MKDEMIQAKKDTYKQCQKGITRMGFTFQHSELLESVKDAELGHRYYIVFVDADVYDESMGKSKPENCYKENSNATTKIATQIENELPKNEKLTEDCEELNRNVNEKSTKDGDKLRIRAVILCKEEAFQNFIMSISWEVEDCYAESHARSHLLKWCEIQSRSELTTNKQAQEQFKKLDEEFKEWQRQQNIECDYADNLARI